MIPRIQIIPPSPTIHLASLISGAKLGKEDKICHFQFHKNRVDKTVQKEEKQKEEKGWLCNYEAACQSKTGEDPLFRCIWPQTNGIEKKE